MASEELRRELELDVHIVPIEDLCKRFDTNIKLGLTSSQARINQEEYDRNELTPPPRKPEWVKLCGCLLSGPSLPLWLGSIPCFVAYKTGFGINNLYLGATLSSIVTVTGIYSYYKQAQTDNLRESFVNLLPQWALCARDGEKYTVRKEELTLGDIVYVNKGDVVPADIRIVESFGLKVDNSSLTGESEPQSRSPQITRDHPLEAKNLAFYATYVAEGSGLGMVVNIGDNTVMGRIASGFSSPLYPGSSASQRIEGFLFRLSSVTVVVGGGLCVAAYVKDINWLYPVIVGLSLIPTAMYASINDGIEGAFRYLAEKNCYVKSLEALGTLGAITTICTNKTGTITQNRMTASHVWLDNKIQELGVEYEYPASASWDNLERAAVLCNNAEFKPGQEGVHTVKKQCFGNATDAAILKVTVLTINKGVVKYNDVMEYREKHKKVCEIPFNSMNKFQISIHEITEDSTKGNLLVMKGAPEKILNYCETIFEGGSEDPLDDEMRSRIEDAIKELAGLGERVIGFCDLMLPQNEYPIGYPFNADKLNFPMEGLQFLGLMSMIDPPRAAVPDAIAKLRNRHGIKIVMATGDHPITAEAIARSVGILSEGIETRQNIAERLGLPVEEINPRDAKAALIDGNEFRDMSLPELEGIFKNHTEIIFARLSPRQKTIIVEICQGLGHVVAVTGRDLSDTPALKRADLGIAMGVAGKDSAKNAADMILLDDNFASIVSGVEIAKDMFSTLKKLYALTMLTLFLSGRHDHILVPYIRSYLDIPSCLLIGQKEWSKWPRYTA